MIKNGQKGSTPMLITIVVVLLILVGIYLFFSSRNSSSVGTTSTTTNPFAPLNASSNTNTSSGANQTNQPIIPTASPVTQTVPVVQQPISYTQPVIQQNYQPNYQIQTYPSQPISTGSFITQVVPTTNSGYAPPIVDAVATATNSYTPYIPTYALQYPTSTASYPTTNSSTPARTSGGGGGGGDSTTGGIVSGLLGCVTGLLVSGPIGCVVLGILGGLSGSGVIGGSAGSIIGGISSLGIGTLISGIGGGGIGGIFGGGGSGNFGGEVTDVTYCTCSASIMLDVDDVRGYQLQLIYTPGESHLYANYNVYGTGQNVLGTYSSGGDCEVYEGEDCNSEGNPDGTIDLIGTSE